VPDQQFLGIYSQLCSELHENPGGQVGVQPLQRTIALCCCERPLAFAAGECRGDFDGRQSARGDAAGSELSADTGAAGFLDVTLRQSARIEVANQNRSSRSSPTAPARDPPRLRIGRNVGTPSRVGSVTVPFVDSLRSAEDNESSAASGRSSATGSPRSVTITVRPSLTRRRYVPRRVFSSRAPTTFLAMWSL
jgi:hypothetical protein